MTNWKDQLGQRSKKLGFKEPENKKPATIKKNFFSTAGKPGGGKKVEGNKILPLPDKIKNKIDSPDTPNLSLKFYKWADFYNEGFDGLDANSKKRFLNEFVNLSKKKDYRESFSLRRTQLDMLGGGFTMTTATRLVFGIGYQHPMENGFMFDWTSGLPIIPGSSLKGMALRAANLFNDEELDIDGIKKLEKGDIEEIFDTKDGGAGRVIFLPAYPSTTDGTAFFDYDVMTPHYGPYYSEPEKNHPADYYSPVPIYFLTVPHGITYTFRVADRYDLTARDSTILKKAHAILKFGLAEVAVGAMTDSSYGYFEDAEDAKEK